MTPLDLVFWALGVLVAVFVLGLAAMIGAAIYIEIRKRVRAADPTMPADWQSSYTHKGNKPDGEAPKKRTHSGL